MSSNAGALHPEAPRMFATLLRDWRPLAPDILARMRDLDTGRHPTLTAMRAALGLDLDWSAATMAARNAASPRGAVPTDSQLCAVLDAMYCAITSSRVVRAEMSSDGVSASREAGPILLRDEEHLTLLAFAGNKTGAPVRFSAEAHGEGIGGTVDPERTASALLDAGAMHPGSYLLPVLMVADGVAATVDVPIECRPSGMLRVRVVDEATGEPVAARVYLRDDVGAAWPVGADIRRDAHGNAFFHADGAFSVRISGTARLRIIRGIEYEAWEKDIAVTADGDVAATASLRRWSDMRADGWYSGDVHVHMQYGGEYLLEPRDAALAQRAEDIHFMNMMVANQGSGWVHDDAHFTGKPHELSDSQHILRWGEEYRDDFYGHMCLFGIDELVSPVYMGVRESDNPHDTPANADAARRCHEIGGTLSYAHPLFESGDLDRVFAREYRRSVEAKELPVDAALGLVDAVDVLSYPGKTLATCELWYRLLNCGLRLAATAGTDTFMSHADLGEFSNPPGGDRVFVKVDGPFETESWCEGVRRGRTFVTNGPMLSIDAGGHQVGDEIEARVGDVLHIEPEAGSALPMDRIELIVNGQVVARADAEDGGKRARLTHDLTVESSCWIAVRAVGPVHDLVLDPDGLFAHTSPIYVTVDGASANHPSAAAYFVEWIDRLIDLAAREGRYASDDDRQAVAGLFRTAQAYYRALLGDH